MIRRSEHSAANRYAQISRKLAQDKHLSFQARGLLLYILSKPANWEIRNKDLMKEGSLGRDAVAKTLKELSDNGYFRRERIQGEGGHFKYIQEVLEEPEFTDNQPLTETPYTVKPDTVNQSTAIEEVQAGAHVPSDYKTDTQERAPSGERVMPAKTSRSALIGKRPALVHLADGEKLPKEFLFPDRLIATEEIVAFAADHGYEGDDLRDTIESMLMKRLRDDKKYKNERELALDIQYWITQCAQNRDKRREANYG